MKITKRRVLRKAGFSDTWLAPWVDYVFKIKEYVDGRKIMQMDKDRVITINGYMKYFSKPIK